MFCPALSCGIGGGLNLRCIFCHMLGLGLAYCSSTDNGEFMVNGGGRVVALEEGCNFRDLGGYKAKDGREVKRGTLYRSGVMAYFTEADKTLLAQLGIKTICDLRRSEERDTEPTAWPVNTDVNIVHWDDEIEFVGTSGLSWRNVSSGDEAREVMLEFYRGMPAWLENRLRGVFSYVLADDLPLLFHCAGGKDRTGLTAALVLHCLGVPREVILEDYQLTNTAIDMEQFMRSKAKAQMGLADNAHPMLKMPQDVRRAMISANAEYLSASLNHIDSEYQSIDNFLYQRLGVTDALRLQLQQRLLV